MFVCAFLSFVDLFQKILLFLQNFLFLQKKIFFKIFKTKFFLSTQLHADDHFKAIAVTDLMR